MFLRLLARIGRGSGLRCKRERKNWMQLDAVRRKTRLTMCKIEERHACHLNFDRVCQCEEALGWGCGHAALKVRAHLLDFSLIDEQTPEHCTSGISTTIVA